MTFGTYQTRFGFLKSKKFLLTIVLLFGAVLVFSMMNLFVAVDPNIKKAIEIANEDPVAKSLVATGIAPSAYKLSEDRRNSLKSSGDIPADASNVYMVDYKGATGLSVVVDVDSGKVLRRFMLTEVRS
jgi:hypothetical protein